MLALPFASKNFISNCAGHKDGVTGACLSSDCKKAVTLSYDHTARLWDIETGECLGNMQHGGAVTRAAFSKDNTLLITASADNLSFLWKCDAAHKPHPVQIFKVCSHMITSPLCTELQDLHLILVFMHNPRTVLFVLLAPYA